MLMSMGRAAARRAVTSAPSALSLAGRQTSLVLRPAVRTFSNSRWNRKVEASPSTDGKKAPRAKKASSTATKTKKKPAVKKAKKKAPKVKKPAIKKKAKKDMTPEEIKEANLKLWRRMALLKEQPGKKPDNRWNVYLAENLSWKAEGQTFGDRVTEMKASFDNLSAQQKERLDAQAAANREATKADRLAWVESEPIENIYLANLARRRIGRATGKRVHLITDHRIPKHPGNAFTLYIKARKDPSDQRDVRDRIKALAVEWHNLPPAEKRPFEDRWAADSQKYSQELEPIVQKAKERESQIKAAARNPVKNAPKV